MSQRTQKRILIVDDDPNVAMLIAKSLGKANKGYIVDTAENGEGALTKVQQAPYDLVLTDYRMPEINGLDLARAIIELTPETQVVLMTAYGTRQFRDSVKGLRLAGYLDKPFTVAQIREIVERALERTQRQKETPPASTHPAIGEPVSAQLEALRSDTGARCVLLISAEGYPVDAVGYTEGLNLSNLSALIAANFVAASELATMLGNRAIFRSSYHEGTDYNVYSYDINGAFLLAVIFGAESKVGAVWHYAKQIATRLGPLLTDLATTPDFAQDMATAIDTEMDRLLNLETDNKEEISKDGGEELMNLEEAIASGLLSPDILRELEK